MSYPKNYCQGVIVKELFPMFSSELSPKLLYEVCVRLYDSFVTIFQKHYFCVPILTYPPVAYYLNFPDFYSFIFHHSSKCSPCSKHPKLPWTSWNTMLPPFLWHAVTFRHDIPCIWNSINSHMCQLPNSLIFRPQILNPWCTSESLFIIIIIFGVGGLFCF